MILVVIGIAIAVLVVGVICWHISGIDDFWDVVGAVCITIGGLGTLASIVFAIAIAVDVSSLGVIDEKIAMYEEENEKIENQIAVTVKQYQEYEKEVFTEVSPDSAITLVSMYPELKSDKLVQSQIEVYVANNEKIKELKEQKIGGVVSRWWLYFGG